MPDFRDIPGMVELWERTRGDERIRVALLDGPVVLEHPCFEGARISRPPVHWDPGEPGEHYEDFVMHGTHIASEIVGQWGTEVEGIAPDVTVINIPVGWGISTGGSTLVLTQGLEMAVDLGVDIIHVASCLPTCSAQPEPLLGKIVERAVREGILVVAPAGNNSGESECLPAVLPGVLTVGGLTDEGYPRGTSNHGGHYDLEGGVMAPGENVLGAHPDGGVQRQKGTSVAAPIVSAVAALLGSLQLRQQGRFDGPAIREALLATATPCPEGAEPGRCLSGVLNIPGAMQRLFGELPEPLEGLEPAAAPEPEACQPAVAPAAPIPPNPRPARLRLAYILGELGYDFESEARRDSFRERLAEPDDAAGMAAFLEANPAEARRLIWTLNLQDAPLYALRPDGSFAEQTYAVLVAMLKAQVQGVQRVSVPGFLVPETLALRTGELLPVVVPFSPRGMYGWSTPHLVEAALGGQASPAELRALEEFLNRVYFEYSNLGLAAPDRALNFVATNAFQAAQVLTQAVALGLELDDIQVAKSPYGRVDGDCWDVLLRFGDPDNDHRAQRMFRLTVDVADVMPVTIGKIQSWSVPKNGNRLKGFRVAL